MMRAVAIETDFNVLSPNIISGAAESAPVRDYETFGRTYPSLPRVGKQRKMERSYDEPGKI